MKAQEAQKLFLTAQAAADRAYDEAAPTPMVVGSPSTFFGADVDPQKPRYYVADGVCGFGWVRVRPARGSFVSWAKKAGKAQTDAYEGGAVIWSPSTRRGQSYERNSAAARAFARVLQEAGISAYAECRLD